MRIGKVWATQKPDTVNFLTLLWRVKKISAKNSKEKLQYKLYTQLWFFISVPEVKQFRYETYFREKVLPFLKLREPLSSNRLNYLQGGRPLRNIFPLTLMKLVPAQFPNAVAKKYLWFRLFFIYTFFLFLPLHIFMVHNYYYPLLEQKPPHNFLTKFRVSSFARDEFSSQCLFLLFTISFLTPNSPRVNHSIQKKGRYLVVLKFHMQT